MDFSDLVYTFNTLYVIQISVFLAREVSIIYFVASLFQQQPASEAVLRKGGAINGLAAWGLSEGTKISPKNLSYGVNMKEEGGKQPNCRMLGFGTAAGIYINAWPIDFNRKCVRMNNEPNCLVKRKITCGRQTTGAPVGSQCGKYSY